MSVPALIQGPGEGDCTLRTTYVLCHFTTMNNAVTYRPIARQRLGKHISAGANARNDRMSSARQRISKHA
jgi:hypothetical protein